MCGFRGAGGWLPARRISSVAPMAVRVAALPACEGLRRPGCIRWPDQLPWVNTVLAVGDACSRKCLADAPDAGRLVPMRGEQHAYFHMRGGSARWLRLDRALGQRVAPQRVQGACEFLGQFRVSAVGAPGPRGARVAPWAGQPLAFARDAGVAIAGCVLLPVALGDAGLGVAVWVFPVPCRGGGRWLRPQLFFVKSRCLFFYKAMSVILRSCKAVSPFQLSQCLFW